MLNKDLQLALHDAVAEAEPAAYAVYESLHQYPELAMQEYNTSRLIRQRVQAMGGFEEPLPVGPTGLLYKLEGARPGRGLLLRADMDALPIQEDAEHTLHSKIAGVMHACGHDSHTAILLGTMQVLQGLRQQLAGTVYFFFQPAEEGLGGAKLLLQTPEAPLAEIDAVCACHMMPDLYAGEIGLQAGAILASADHFDITVNGKGGHGAHPYTTVDSVTIATGLVQQLQNLLAREVCALDAAVLSVCSIHSEGDAYNIIPDRVHLKGTLRTMNPDVRVYLQQRLREVCEGFCTAQRATCEVQMHQGPPSLHNDTDWVKRTQSVLSPLLGADAVKQLRIATMGAEDFAYIKERYPGIFIRVGCRTQGRDFTPIHSGRFTVDRKALTAGMLTISGLALDFCASEVADDAK